MTVTLKPGPVKPLIKPVGVKPPVSAVTPAPAPAAAKPAAKPAPSKQAAAVIEKMKKPPVQSIAPEDDPSSGGEQVAEQEQQEVQPGDTLIGKAGVGIVTKKNADGTETTEQIPVSDVIVKEPHATIGVSVGITKNLGNYESVKVQVSLFLPCAVDGDAVEETYTECKTWVDEKINEVNDQIEAQKSE